MKRNTCERCTSPLTKRGRCTDRTCPFSDCAQDDAKGWIGHPNPPVPEGADGHKVCIHMVDVDARKTETMTVDMLHQISRANELYRVILLVQNQGKAVVGFQTAEFEDHHRVIASNDGRPVYFPLDARKKTPATYVVYFRQ